jgi:Arc/MetJ-type ribon-helix-helix transcriptional regulator
MSTPVSVRIEDDLLRRLRVLAGQADVHVSDLVRAAVKRMLAPRDGLEELGEQQQPYTYRCVHMSISGDGLRSARCSWCTKP